MSLPLISCLCVSRNNTNLVNESICSFLNQTYTNKELIFVYEDNNEYIQAIRSKFSIETYIQFIEIPSLPKKTLGELRNISIHKANGSILVQWDDDDIYHQERIALQYSFMIENKVSATMLDQRLVLMNNTLYQSNIWPFEGSIMIYKDIFTRRIINTYVEMNRCEDSILLVDLLQTKHIEFMHCPALYLYRYTGNNVWHKGHFEEIVHVSTKLVNISNTNYQQIINEIKPICQKSNLKKDCILERLIDLLKNTRLET